MSDKGPKEELQTIDDVIDKFQNAMLVTESLEHQVRARPMVIADHNPGGELVFATRVDDRKTDEILETPRVAVTMQAEGRYVSISGEAQLETDHEKIEELWSPAWDLWFPEGVEDPSLRLIRVRPSRAEYWDRTGIRKLEFLWEAGKALLQGRKARDEELSGHGRVNID